jgi:hypothetical protein
MGAAARMNFLDWFLIGWVVVSAIATPLVGRLVADRLGESSPEESPAPEWSRTVHD